MTGRLDGKVALISGAAMGQGEAEARRFVAEGARVMIGDVADEPAVALAAALGDSAEYVHLDVRDPSSWAAAVGATEQRWGRLDVLVNNAGILRFGAIADTSVDDYLAVIMVNQVGTFLGMRAAIPAMRRAGGGSIVNISSVEGMAGMAGLAAYSSSKFAVRGLTRVGALELAADGIRVNVVVPGMVRTPMTEVFGDTSAAHRVIPAGRAGEPADIAAAVLFLASDESDYCTGTELVVDGGVLAGSAFSALH